MKFYNTYRHIWVYPTDTQAAIGSSILKTAPENNLVRVRHWHTHRPFRCREYVKIHPGSATFGSLTLSQPQSRVSMPIGHLQILLGHQMVRYKFLWTVFTPANDPIAEY